MKIIYLYPPSCVSNIETGIYKTGTVYIQDCDDFPYQHIYQQ